MSDQILTRPFHAGRGFNITDQSEDICSLED